MSDSPPALCRYLDARAALPATESPLADAVNIPVSELARRTHELPPAFELIAVADTGPEAHAAARWLTEHGRRAVVEPAPGARDRGARDSGARGPGARGSAERGSAERGSADARPGRLWRPNDWLEAWLAQTPAAADRRTALDLACGTGRDAVYLATCGWTVTAIDVLPDALDRGRALAERYGVAERVQWLARDLERDILEHDNVERDTLERDTLECANPERGTLGLDTLEPGGLNFSAAFDLIVIFRYLHRPLLKRAMDWLRPGGSLLSEVFTATHRERHGRPASAADVVRPDELPQLLPGLTIRRHVVDGAGSAHVARVWAQRPA